ncbi:hypothetical protein GXW83_23400 [Streptacidiphilus sp. PB12-B1b]|uniref:hypothetical protein n=1 Tax=Streptacidiphilus sp. PB12-B1b TaxID=2705012 RepID=UPI0015F79CE7|nr:hypothetical protein [Streptacidiphilus sp. PB12-B1b]QMU78208.1 hypothetical protein GXW83_23400 [Streptacidiphilus sp. PB12-B1b]
MDMGQEARKPDGDPAALHLQELAFFLSVHLDRAPGVLWPDHDHPALGARADPLLHRELASGISRLTGLALQQGGHDPSGRGVAEGHLLVHQTGGSTLWRLDVRAGGGRSAALRWCLRAGEVLYVPVDWAWQSEPATRSRSLITRLVPA